MKRSCRRSPPLLHRSMLLQAVYGPYAQSLGAAPDPVEFQAAAVPPAVALSGLPANSHPSSRQALWRLPQSTLRMREVHTLSVPCSCVNRHRLPPSSSAVRQSSGDEQGLTLQSTVQRTSSPPYAPHTFDPEWFLLWFTNGL